MLRKKSQVFEPSQSFQDVSFGLLKSNVLIACTLDKKIKIWNLVSTECVTTLECHAKDIECLETIDENRFASGSFDKTIRIGDAKNFVCLKKLTTNHKNGFTFLKKFDYKKPASGPLREIKIWKIETGE